MLIARVCADGTAADIVLPLQSHRRSHRRRRRRWPLESVDRPVDKDASEVSISEQPNDSPSTLDSTDRLNKSTYDAGSKQGSSKIAEDKTRDDSDDVEGGVSAEAKGKLLKGATSIAASMMLLLNVVWNPQRIPSGSRIHRWMIKKHHINRLCLSKNCKFIDQGMKFPWKKLLIMGKNGWGQEYRLELQQQCFNVENYYENFHHYNFNVKMKKYDSDEWNETIYFAEVAKAPALQIQPMGRNVY
uniref:DUF3615 domain-containing protein n=1 Tax=Oryza punctata TaxID=4537 RepID=A0A0E0MHN5_ORYPU